MTCQDFTVVKCGLNRKNLSNPGLYVLVSLLHRRDGVVVRASASQLVDLGFISLVES